MVLVYEEGIWAFMSFSKSEAGSCRSPWLVMGTSLGSCTL